MKFGRGFQRVRIPPGQSIASGPVANLAAPATTVGLMRSAANKWAVGLQPRNHRHSGAQGFTAPEGSILVSALASERGTGGVVDHGTVAEEAPVTWEALVLPANDIRASGGPVTSLRRAGPTPMQARPVWRQVRPARRRSIGMQVGAPREDRRSADEARESDDRIVAKKSGNGWQPKPAEQRRSVSRENRRREP